jgi:hypothetical protein
LLLDFGHLVFVFFELGLVGDTDFFRNLGFVVRNVHLLVLALKQAIKCSHAFLKTVDFGLDINSSFNFDKGEDAFVHESLEDTLGFLFTRLKDNGFTTSDVSLDNRLLGNKHVVDILACTLNHDSRLGVRGDVQRGKLRSDLSTGESESLHLLFSIFEAHATLREGSNADRLGHLSGNMR